jgi:hypothetical protein
MIRGWFPSKNIRFDALSDLLPRCFDPESALHWRLLQQLIPIVYDSNFSDKVFGFTSSVDND